ncbi:uncharacterized protein LOC126724294 isoform X2 [Quercus robur]|uniref:uncharacterized protein LOC126724294 isoform X2 n=1 Tax=Quercus robur TaxID=38942 RepID=UPI0021610DD2|nr:uncharacterized protein LOC126724294 isoform X2 [Quercus robur]
MNKIIPRKENIPFHLTMLIPSLPNTVTTQIGISPLVFTTYILLLFFLALLGTNNLQLPAPQDVSACNSDICISYPLLTRLSPEAPVYPYVTKDVMHKVKPGSYTWRHHRPPPRRSGFVDDLFDMFNSIEELTASETALDPMEELTSLEMALLLRDLILDTSDSSSDEEDFYSP